MVSTNCLCYLTLMTLYFVFLSFFNLFYGRDKAYFVDLFVRASNTPAIKMYEKVVSCFCIFQNCLNLIVSASNSSQIDLAVMVFQLGYVIYRRVLRYYSGEEDGLGQFHL